jgi:hypothetical protein
MKRKGCFCTYLIRENITEPSLNAPNLQSFHSTGVAASRDRDSSPKLRSVHLESDIRVDSSFGEDPLLSHGFVG